MAISSVTICNMALSHIGAGQIQALDEASAEAIQCNLWYDISRKQALQAHNWAFARKRATLTVHGDDAPEDVWGFRYQYPVDCMVAREIENPMMPSTGVGTANVFGTRPQDVWLSGDAIPFEVEMSDDGTKSILTNMEDAKLIYTFDQDSVSMFSLVFIDALAYLIAGRTAFPITGKATLAKDMFAAYREVLRSSTAVDANEGIAGPPREAEWIRKR